MSEPRTAGSPAGEGPGEGGRTPGSLLLAAAVVAVEALALAALAVAEVVSVVGDRAGLALSTTVFFVLGALGLGYVARGLLRHQSGVRGPAVLAQLLALGLAWSFRSTDPVLVPLALAVVGAVGLGALLSPGTTAALVDVGEEPEVPRRD